MHYGLSALFDLGIGARFALHSATTSNGNHIEHESRFDELPIESTPDKQSLSTGNRNQEDRLMLDAVAKWLFRVVAAVFVTAYVFSLALGSLQVQPTRADLKDQVYQEKVKTILKHHVRVDVALRDNIVRDNRLRDE
jgi:hypothetical protein